MSPLTAVAIVALSATPARVLVTSYQSLGVDSSTMPKLAEGFRAGATKPPLEAMGAEASDEAGRAATMCGEDAACLSTVGQRTGARYVLAYGVGKVGSALLVSAIFIDVSTGKEIARASQRVAEASPDWAAVTRELSELVVKPPAEATVVEVPVYSPERPHRLRTAGFVLVGLTVACGIVSTGFGLAALGNYSKLKAETNYAQYATDATAQRTLNGFGDGFLIAGVLGAAVSVVLLVLDAHYSSQSPTVDPTSTAPAATW